MFDQTQNNGIHHPHACFYIYSLSNRPIYGNVEGFCRITGQQSQGVVFEKWVRDTFTDLGFLHPGNIISNEAMFCFEEGSEYLKQLTGKDKPQRFRNYSHFVVNGKWHIKDKGQKEDMLKLMLSNPEICVIAESGQRHLLFKHKPRTWQLEDVTMQPDRQLFILLHYRINQLSEAFSNDEISSAQYQQHRIVKFGLKRWFDLETIIKLYRGSAMFDLALFFSKIKPIYNE